MSDSKQFPAGYSPAAALMQGKTPITPARTVAATVTVNPVSKSAQVSAPPKPTPKPAPAAPAPAPIQAAGIAPFMPPRGGRGSQDGDGKPVPSNFFQPPEAVAQSKFWRYVPGAIFMGWCGNVPIGVAYDGSGRLDDRHLITVAGARGGKTTTLLMPNLRLYEGSTLVLDPKGELATATAQYRRDKLGHTVRVLDPWRVASVPDNVRGTFDPLAELMNPDARAMLDRVDDAALMAEALIQDQGDNNAHWTGSARELLRGVILWFAHSDALDLSKLPELLAAMMTVDEKTPADDNPFAHMIEFAKRPDLPQDVAAVIHNAADGTMGTQARERSSIISTARNQLGFLESGPLRRDLVRGDFSLRDLKRKPMTIYLCLPASRMETHAKWLRLILNQSMAALEREPRRPDTLPVLLMLEEFAALGHMRALEIAASYMAGFGVKLWAVIQDLTQLKRHYKEGWETFLGNAGVLSVFAPNDMTTMAYVSKRLGETAVYVEEDQDLNESDTKAGRTGVKRNFQRVPLLAPDEIAMEFGRRSSRALLIPADGPPIAIERRRVDDPLFSTVPGSRK